jgi:hypothetical protein
MNVDVAMELIEVVRTLILLGDTTSAVTVLVEAKGVDLFDMSRVWKLLDKDMNERGTLWGLQGDDEDQTLWRAFSYAICTRVETRWKQDFPTLRKLLSHIVGMEPPDDCYSKFNYALYKAWEVGAARIPGVVFTRHAWILDQGGRAVRIFRTGWKGEPTVIYVVSEGDTVMHCSRDFFRSRTNARYHAEEDCAPCISTATRCLSPWLVPWAPWGHTTRTSTTGTMPCASWLRVGTVAVSRPGSCRAERNDDR